MALMKPNGIPYLHCSATVSIYSARFSNIDADVQQQPPCCSHKSPNHLSKGVCKIVTI